MRRILSAVAVTLGILALILGTVVRFAVAPAKAVLPSNTDTTRTYTGTAAALFNPAALTGGGTPLLKGVPITVAHRTQVTGTKGDNAKISDSKVVSAAGSPVASVNYTYAVNRTNLGAGSGFTGVVAQQGLTFNWPVRTAKHDYVGWVSDTHATTNLKYTGTATRGGITTYVFTTTTAPAPITDGQVLAALPAGLPKTALAQLAGQLGLPAAELQQLQVVLPSLPDVVPFHYTYQVTATYWVAPKSGIVVDLTQHEVRTLVLSIGGQNVAVTPVMDISFTSPATTLAAAAQDAKDKAGAIDLVYVQLPIGLVVGGALLVLAGVAGLLIRRPSRGTGAGPGPLHERIEPTVPSGS